MSENGRLPASDLAKTVVGVTIRKDLVRQTDQMALAFYRKFKAPMRATDGYRSYERQVITKAEKGDWAAEPGTSNHGWGKAIDWASSINSGTSEEHRWMEQNGPKYGWTNPEWARNENPNDGRYEPWHWEAVRKNVNAPYVGFPGKGQTGYGSSGAKVKEVQELLKDYGFKRLKADSDFGMVTGDAVVRFQEDKGLKQDGIVGANTLAALKGGKVADPLPAPKPDDGPTKRNPTRLPTIDRGSESGWVPVIQRLVGADDDGVFGPATEGKVKAFQRRQGLKQDGIVGLRTWTQFLYGHAIARGDRGDRVKVAQNMVGLSGSDADGIVGPQTHGRIVETQRGLSISVTGVIGPEFRNAYLKHFNA